jgi:multiphosphoryl transfer protein
MVGIVVVSHSPALAEGVVALAREMGGADLPLEAAGGMEDGSIGTDAERVRAAIERAMSDDGVLVLMDLGSALMSAEIAIELLAGRGPVVLSEAPLVEGTVAAAALAGAGASLEEVRAEAARALQMKVAQLGPSEPEAPPEPASVAPDSGGLEARIPVVNDIGLHARPAALVVELAGRFDADLRLAKAGGPGPVSARSLTGLMTLVAREGDQLVARASGPQAGAALAALEELARGGFGEGVGTDSAAASRRRDSGPAADTEPAREPEPPPEQQPPPPGAQLDGIAASAGIALGPARHLKQELGPVLDHPSEGPEVEWQRLEAARHAARTEIEHDRDEVQRRGAKAEAAIFSAHLALLDDDAIVALARAGVERGDAAEAAWHQATEETAAQWRGLEDALLRERAADVVDVGRRVLAALAGRELHAELSGEGILITSELTPGEAAGLRPGQVHGIATAHGTATAHAAILARGLGLPAVVGLGPSVLAITEGTQVLLDGGEGTLVVAPSNDAAAAARRKLDEGAARRERALEHAGERAVTRDGTVVEVSANLGGGAEAARAVSLGADGVGLLRSEFLFLDRPEIPSEDEQADVLREIAAALAGRPLIVRTLDVGADKPLPAVPVPAEANPFLGRRGLRLSLQEPGLFGAQLRAILRVAADYPVKVMFPMVATAAELDAALAAVEDARAATGVFGPVEVGIMVEVPAAALLAERLARRADFFSIGTNDLTQYTMAAERGNELVGDLLSGIQPAVLRLVQATSAGADAHGRWVGVCGELAGDPAAAVLFVGLGVRELSMAPPLMPEVKEALRGITVADAAAAAERALTAEDAAAARAQGADLL